MFSFYKKYEQENQKKVVKSAILGIAAGAVTAFFLSPIRGSQARKIVADKARMTAQNIENRFSDTVTNVGEGIRDVGSNIKDKVEEAKAVADREANKARGKAADSLSDTANKVNPNSR